MRCFLLIFRNLVDLKTQALSALQTARKWQSENSAREKIINLKLIKYNEHINTLMEDRETLLNKLKEMHRDEIILRKELDRLKEMMFDHRGSKCEISRIANLPGLLYDVSSQKSSCIDRYASDPELNDVKIILNI